MDQERKSPAILAFRVPPALVEKIDQFAELQCCINRSDAARQLLIVGLERSTKGERAA
jgi:metal-responsive CopG/Arc/MetJ family transcriptional regulator